MKKTMKNLINVMSDENCKDNFYPTPSSLSEEMLKLVDFDRVNTILEPSAGKGDLVDSLIEKLESLNYSKNDIYRHGSFEIHLIEKDDNLRNLLLGKYSSFNTNTDTEEYSYNPDLFSIHVIGDDYMKFNSDFYYDLIVMNPPFDHSVKHISKAINTVARKGGQLVCLLNAQTLKNPYSNERKQLVNILDSYSCEENCTVQIKYVSDSFLDSDSLRKTDVEIAIVYLDCLLDEDKNIFNKFKDSYFEEDNEKEVLEETRMALGDYFHSLVCSYNEEVKYGVEFIKQYYSLKKNISTISKDNFTHILDLKIGDQNADYFSVKTATNRYIKSIRLKYWKYIINSDVIRNKATSDMINSVFNEIGKFRNYEFNYYNLKQLQINLTNNLISGIEESIIGLFDTFSDKYSYLDESSKNIHYFNGWKTNKSHKINEKVIIPVHSVDWNNKFSIAYEHENMLYDLFTAIGYIAQKNITHSEIRNIIETCVRENQRKNVDFPYLTLSFYKKGTCHIKFKDKKILEKLNRIGANKRGWLPPSYGKKAYSDMTEEEQACINEFEGKQTYEDAYYNNDLNYINDKNCYRALLG